MKPSVKVNAEQIGRRNEQKRIIDATTGSLVAFNTDGTKVIYLTGLEGEAND
jgi:hypothetical protein